MSQAIKKWFLQGFTRFFQPNPFVLMSVQHKGGRGGGGTGVRGQELGDGRWTGSAGLDLWFGDHDLIVRVLGLIACKV